MDALSVSAGAAGFISLGITVCQGLLDYYRSWRGADEQVTRMYASIEALTETFRLLEPAIQSKQFSHATVLKVEESIRSAEKGLRSLEKKLQKVRLAPSQPGWKAKGMAQLRRTLFPFKESTLAKLKELGIELRQELSLALEVLQIECSAASVQKLDAVVHGLNKVSIGVDMLQEQSASMSNNIQSLGIFSQIMSKSVDGLVATQSDDYRRKVYDWLSPLTVEFQRTHLNTFDTPGRQDSTAQSLIETAKFRHWQNTSCETLWCPGIPGTGKTIFASYTINHLQGIIAAEKATRLAYFYLNYKDAKKQDIPNLLTSLVCQVALSEPVLSSELIASYQAHGSGVTHLSHTECTQLLRSTLSCYTKIFLIIDAFDEYPEECRGQLLAELHDLKPGISMLITSRDLPTIERQLSQAVRLDVRARSDDILQYLRERIPSFESLKSHIETDPTLSNLISTTITAKAGGMFLQARLYLESLTTKTTLRKLKNRLTMLPEGLNSTYDEVLERINAQHPDQAALARKVICWVFHAFRPLTMPELQHALAVETGDSDLDADNIPEEGLLLSVCNGLITYEKEGLVLTLVHYTFQQYLEHKAETLFPEAQIEIVTTCLTYLCFDEFEQGPCLADNDLRARLKQWPLLSYAVPKWGQHARQGAEEACSNLIFSFLSQHAKLSASIQVPWERVSTGFIISRPSSSEVFPLWVASLYGLEYTVSHLLADQNHTVNKKTTWGSTALHEAARCGNVKILEMLLSNGADIAAKMSDGNTSLHSACLYNVFLRERDWAEMHLKTAGLLLDHGADVNAVNLEGRAALHFATMGGQPSLTQLLLARGADVTLRDRYGIAPLTNASRYGDEGIVRILLEHDLQRQVQYDIPNEAMKMATLEGQLSMLQDLLVKTSEQPPVDWGGRNLIHLSAYGGHLHCLQYVESIGVDLEALDKQERTSLHFAAASEWERSRQVLEYLLERGLDSCQRDFDGWTPLLWAAKAGIITNIQTLLDVGAGSVYRGDQEWIPFAVAIYHDNVRAAEMLQPHDGPLPEIFQTDQSSLSLEHHSVQCDGCELPIFGSRYKCSQCPDFDYCFKCFSSAEITHPSHQFDFIYWNYTNEDVQRIDRQEVMKELRIRETYMMSCKA